MLIRIILAALATWATLSPLPAAAGTYRVQVANKSPYCVSLVGVAVPGTDPAEGVFVHFPGPQKTNLLSGKTITGTYAHPRPAKTVEIQAGPCTPNTALPRKFAHADQPGREHNVFTIRPGPDRTIVVK